MSKSNQEIPPFNPDPQASNNNDVFHSGANWFYWVAGLSLVNSINLYVGNEWSFVIGLGVTQLFDYISMEISMVEPEASAIIKTLRLALVNIASVIFLLFGWLANKKNQWAFIIGMVLYLLDGLLFLMVPDWMSIGFHVVALFFMFRGYRSLKELSEEEARAGIKSSGKGGRSPLLWLTLTLVGAMTIIGYIVIITTPVQSTDGTDFDTSAEFDESIINSQAELDDFVEYYYRRKDADRVSSAMSFIDKGSDVSSEILLGGVAGFYGAVFRDNPDRLDKWIIDIDGFTERGQHLFFNALWISNTPKARKYLEQKTETATGDFQIGLRELVESEPSDMRTVVPKNTVEGDMLWGAFLATGDPIFIVNMIEATTQCSGRKDYEAFVCTAIGKWSLAANAQQHEIVYRTLQQQLSNYGGEEREIIQDILDKADMPSGPSIIKEEALRFIEEQQKKGKWLEFIGQ